MDRLLDALEGVERKLELLGLRYALVGGMAVSAWGRARLTQDIDVKVSLSREDLGDADLFAPELTPLHPDTVKLAKLTGVVFLLDSSGCRVDVMLRDTPFDEAVVDRATRVTLAEGREFRICTPEDLIIYKLLSSRPHDHADAAGVVKRQAGRLDRHYIKGWLSAFEGALDDSTLVTSFLQLSPEP